MYSPTWTIDDFAPLGAAETAKAAVRWLLRRVTKLCAVAFPVSVQLGRGAGVAVIATVSGAARAVGSLRVSQTSDVERVDTASLVAGMAARSASRTARALAGEDMAATQSGRRGTTGAPAINAQWSRCAEIVGQSIDRVRVTERHQAAALQQLDLAQYGLSSMKIELSSVMAIPGFEAKARLHRLPHRMPDAGRRLAASGSAAAA